MSSSINALPSNSDHINRAPYIDTNASTISGPTATTTTFSTTYYPTTSIPTLQQAHQTNQNFTHPTPQSVAISYPPSMPIVQNAIESPIITKSIEEAIVTNTAPENIPHQQMPKQMQQQQVSIPPPQQQYIPLSTEYHQIQNQMPTTQQAQPHQIQQSQQAQMQRSTDDSEIISK